MCLGSLKDRLCAMARARSQHRALKVLAGLSGNGVLIMPTTVGALGLAQKLCERRCCRVTSGPVTADPRWKLLSHIRTPAEIVREFAGERRLGALVISFPDQIAGEGESFVTLRFLGLERRFSLLEAVLVLRHQPYVCQYRSCRPCGAYRLQPIPYSDALSAADHRTAPARLTRTLLAGLEEELRSPPADWLGAASFALKSEIAYEFRVREELKEVESLLRLAIAASLERGPDLGPALASVTSLVRDPVRATLRVRRH
jgi:hypothetical protein